MYGSPEEVACAFWPEFVLPFILIPPSLIACGVESGDPSMRSTREAAAYLRYAIVAALVLSLAWAAYAPLHGARYGVTSAVLPSVLLVLWCAAAAYTLRNFGRRANVS